MSLGGIGYCRIAVDVKIGARHTKRGKDRFGDIRLIGLARYALDHVCSKRHAEGGVRIVFARLVSLCGNFGKQRLAQRIKAIRGIIKAKIKGSALKARRAAKQMKNADIIRKI